jgi:glucose/mannose-6-phosphate isomerase
MLDAAERAPDQWHDGIARARAVDLAHVPPDLAGVVVCGMGGSGIAGDVAACVAAGRSAIPVAVTKGYALPAFAGPHTLVVLCSYSGDTEETLACFDQAHERGAPIVAVATGGKLAELAHAHDAPCVTPPAGYQPRAAFPSLAAAVLVVLERIGVLGDLTGELIEADGVLREQAGACSRDIPSDRNPAKRLASAVHGRGPLVWGQEGPLGVAALRWRMQLNENAKLLAFSGTFSEAGHNEIVGFDAGVAAQADLAVIALRSPTEHPRIAMRLDAALRLVRERVPVVEEAHARGTGQLAQLASAVQLGDLVSIYLAILRGVDPTPVHAIERLKAELT